MVPGYYEMKKKLKDQIVAIQHFFTKNDKYRRQTEKALKKAKIVWTKPNLCEKYKFE